MGKAQQKNRFFIYVFLLIMLISFTPSLFSQTNLIPNPSFEIWNGGEPVNWQTTNDTLRGRISVTPSALAYHGNSAIQLETIDFNGIAGGAFVKSDTFSVGVLEDRPIELSGYYRFAPVGDAICVVNVLVLNYFGSFLVGCGFGIDTLAAAEEYTRFAIPIFYGSPFDTAVSVAINLKVHAQSRNAQSIGAIGLVDSLTLSTSITNVNGHNTKHPQKFELSQNYPNPFNPKTIINYELPITNYVDLSIYNILGQKVISLVNKKQEAGSHKVEWNASEYPSGVYYYQLYTGDYMEVKKMILLK